MSKIFKRRIPLLNKLSLPIICVLFSILYFPQTLIMNENVDTIAAFEIDASLMIDSVFQHLKTYNLQLGYMSRFYGWSYFFINFLLLKPVFIIEKLLSIENISFNIFLVKVIFFLISLLSCVFLYILLKKIFKKDSLSFIGCLLYIMFPLKTTFFTDIKPESTGLLFLFLSQIFLINFIEDKKQKITIWYIASIISLTLSLLAKQSFVFMVPPTIIIFYLYFIKSNKISFFKGILNKKIILAIILSLTTVICVTFIVYPHLFKHPDNFINAQKILLKDHSSEGTLTLRGKALFDNWLETIWDSPFLKSSIFFYPISLLILILQKDKFKKIFLVNFLSLPIITFILCKNAALFIDPNYLTPLFPLFLIVILFPLSKSLNIKNLFIKKILSISYVFILITLSLNQFFNTSTDLKKRQEYKQSEVLQVSDFINKEIKTNSKLAISDGVLVSHKENYQTCHWWQNCTLKNYLDEFAPDYFIFTKNMSYNGIEPEYYLNYVNYIKTHNFQLQKTIGRFVIYKKNDSI